MTMKRVEMTDKEMIKLSWDVRGTIIMEILGEMPPWAALSVLSSVFAKKLEDIPDDERSSYIGRLLEGCGPIAGMTKIEMSPDVARIDVAGSGEKKH